MNADPDARLAAAIAELEAATGRVEEAGAGDLDRLLTLMSQRSAAVQRLASLLHEHNSPPPGPLAARIRRQIERGRALRERLLLLRAAHRAELARLLEGQRAASAVSTGKRRPARRLDVRG